MHFLRSIFFHIVVAVCCVSSAHAQLSQIKPSLQHITMIKHQHGQTPERFLFLRYDGAEEFCANLSFAGADADLLSFLTEGQETEFETVRCFVPGESRALLVRAELNIPGLYAAKLHMQNLLNDSETLDIPVSMKYRKVASVSISNVELTRGECDPDFECWHVAITVRNRGFRKTRRGGNVKIKWVFGQVPALELQKTLPRMRQKRARTFAFDLKISAEKYTELRADVYWVGLRAELGGNARQLGRYKKARKYEITLDRYV